MARLKKPPTARYSLTLAGKKNGYSKDSGERGLQQLQRREEEKETYDPQSQPRGGENPPHSGRETQKTAKVTLLLKLWAISFARNKRKKARWCRSSSNGIKGDRKGGGATSLGSSNKIPINSYTKGIEGVMQGATVPEEEKK